MSITEKVAAMFRNGDGVTCKWPGSGDMVITLERRMINDAIAQWQLRDEAGREGAMDSIRSALKRANKRIARNKLSQQEANDLASDIALFIAHELVYADGEQWLAKNPEPSILEGFKP